MARWLRNVGDFLEKLDDVAGEDDDDVVAARDLAKSLQQTPSDDDGENSATLETERYAYVDEASNKEENHLSSSTPTKGSRTENESASTEAIDDEEHIGANMESVDSPQIQDFQTPVATTPAIDKNEEEEFMTPTVDDTLSTVDHNGVVMKQLKAKISTLESEKLEILNEARKLRKHMVTLNEHLERADKEIEAQRGELEQAGRLLEAGRQQAATKLQAAQQGHAAAMLKLQKDSAERLAAAAQKHQQQQDALRHEILQAHDQHQQVGGDLEELSNATKDITSERDAAVVHAQRLQGQLESLNDQLESMTEQAQAASLREQAVATQLDTVTAQHQAILQRHRERETDLEQQLAQVSAALAEKPTNTTPSAAHGPSNQESKSILDDLETCQSQLHAEQEEATRLRAEIQAMQTDRSQELYREQMKHERVIGDLRNEVTELLEKLANQPTTSTADFESQQERLSQQHEQVEALSEQVIRQGELLSRSHGEVAALRARLSAALNRATVAEAAAEAAPLSVSTMRPTRNRRREQPSLREALGGPKRLDTVDKFLSGTIQILRRHPLARLAALLYLLILHLWTLVLLMFHAHASTATTPELMAAAHGPGTLLRSGGPP